jgi:glycosyltransferase involved in cell wall biosynthesis
LKNLSTKLGLSTNNVEFVGFLQTSELYSWYKKAKIFISIPLSDATSISLLEAMSFGCYPILSNIPANLEFIINNINGKINENSTLLANDIMLVIDLLTNNPINHKKIIEQNYNIIKQLANTKINTQYFLKLLAN